LFDQLDLLAQEILGPFRVAGTPRDAGGLEIEQPQKQVFTGRRHDPQPCHTQLLEFADMLRRFLLELPDLPVDGGNDAVRQKDQNQDEPGHQDVRQIELSGDRHVLT
jgi:hypothetical protein